MKTLTRWIATDWYGAMLFFERPRRTRDNGGEWKGCRDQYMERHFFKEIHIIGEDQTYKDKPIKVKITLEIEEL